ncbi:MAG: HAMP domain-containing sensor histidine kinase, partial [Cyclobacteriaceae bacterium]
SMIADYLQTTKLNGVQSEMIGRLNGVVDHLNEVFNELVESISIRYDTEILSEEIHLKKVLKDVMESFENQINSCDAKIEIDFSEVDTIFYPRRYIESIFSNFLSNSLKYRTPSSPPQIKFRSEIQENEIVLSVADNGLGIDTELHKNNLFKIRKVFHDHPDARGFGLFMTKTQVEAMGGSIWVNSKPGEGSTFFVSFPIPNT